LDLSGSRKKKDNKKERLPAALLGLFQRLFPLNKKNSLRSNSFLFFTLRKSTPLHGKKMRPDLDVFCDATLLRSLQWVFFLLRSLQWMFFLLCSLQWMFFLLCLVCFLSILSVIQSLVKDLDCIHVDV